MQPALDLKIPFAWEERRPILLEKCLYLPSYCPGAPRLEEPTVFWKKEGLFANPNLPLAVEFCSGNGEWIAQMAIRFPHLNWIAVEKDFARAKKIWLKAIRSALPNLFIVCGEALTFSSQYLEDGSVEEAWVNFPDPWPKRSHAKHRLVQKPFEEEMRRTLRKGASLTLVTDDERYSAQMIQVFSSWQSLFAPARFAEELPGYGTSYFLNLWQGMAKPIRYHRVTHD